MEFFLQNGEITIAEQSLVKENQFLKQTVEDKELPIFSDCKEKLPNPIWEGHQDAVDCYWKTWELAFKHLRKPVADTGFVSNFIDTAFNDHLFMWDSSFILMFGKYADRIFKFQNTLDNFYAHQHRDGFICRQLIEESGRERFSRYNPSSTGPEVMAWCEWEYYKNFGDKERLSKVFPPLLAYHRWMAEYHTWPDGTYYSTGWGCGMDNIPRQMPGYSTEFSHGHMVWVDACMQALHDCNMLIEMANVLGREEYVLELSAERDSLYKVINKKLWDEKTGFYYDLWRNGKFNGVRHIGAFWALISGCASQKRAKHLISYLRDENEFKTPVRIPALTKSSPFYQKNGGYWCGGVWAPTNYMVLKGLEKYNEFALAHEIGLELLSAVVSVYNDYGTVFENYAPEYVDNGKPSKGLANVDFVGWTGLIPISVLFEYVFGIKPDASNNKIVWDINLLEKHGVEHYPFGNDGELTLLCEARDCADDKPKITAVSNIPVELEIVWGRVGKKKHENITLGNTL